MTPGKTARLYAILICALPLAFQNCSKKNFNFVNPDALAQKIASGQAGTVDFVASDDPAELDRQMDQADAIASDLLANPIVESVVNTQTEGMIPANIPTSEPVDVIVADNVPVAETPASTATDTSTSSSSGTATESTSSSSSDSQASAPQESSPAPVVESAPQQSAPETVVEAAPQESTPAVTDTTTSTESSSSVDSAPAADPVVVADEDEELSDDDDIELIDEDADAGVSCAEVVKAKKHKCNKEGKDLHVVLLIAGGKINLDDIKDDDKNETIFIGDGKIEISIKGHHKGHHHKKKVSVCGTKVKNHKKGKCGLKVGHHKNGKDEDDGDLAERAERHFEGRKNEERQTERFSSALSSRSVQSDDKDDDDHDNSGRKSGKKHK